MSARRHIARIHPSAAEHPDQDRNRMMEDHDGAAGDARPTDYDELIGRAEEMLRNTLDFLGRTPNPSARSRMEELAAKVEADIERYKRAREKQRGF